MIFKGAVTVCVSAVLTLGLLAGCGGGGDDDFVSQANGVCKDANEQINAIDTPKNISGLADYAGQIEPIVADAIDQIKDLTPPEDQVSDVDAWVALLEQQASVIGDAQKKAQVDPQGALALLKQNEKLDKEGDAAAKKLGLDECASN